MWWLLVLLRAAAWCLDRRRTLVSSKVLRRGSGGVTAIFPGLYMSSSRLLHLADPSHTVIGVRILPGRDFDVAEVAQRVRAIVPRPDVSVGFSMGCVVAHRAFPESRRELYAPAGRAAGTPMETALRVLGWVARLLLGTPRVLAMYPTYGGVGDKGDAYVCCGDEDAVHPAWPDADAVLRGVGHEPSLFLRSGA